MANTTTVHCPDCGARVEASPDATAVACPKCSSAFSPWGLPTAARGASTPPPPTPHAPAAPAAPTSEEDLSGSSVGGHRLLRVLGRGGMGTVYEADDPRRGRVAVKVLPAALAKDPQFASRFHREAKVLSGLSHPHLVEVYERGQDGDRCYFVMEYVRGESLRRVMERGPVAWRDATRTTREVLAGLGYAHGRGVVHRDLKPENVLLDENGRARLVDFGLSRIVRGEAAEDLSRLTRTNVILGTYEYMAPEQRLGAATVDERADLYALGVILYEMVTGSLPLGRFEAASILRPGVPAALDAVIHRALASSPKDRFPSAVAFREALDAVEAGRPAAATPAPAAAPAPAAGPEVLARSRVDVARRVLRHVEILAACDRVIGWFLVLGFFGLFSASALTHLRWGWEWGIAGGGSVLLFVGGILMLKQGKRLRAMAPGSREAQVTASFFLLVLFPPIGTALGVYGLVTMTSDASREAFAIGRDDLRSRSWLVRTLAPPRPPAPGNAPPSFPSTAPIDPRRRRRGTWRRRSELLEDFEGAPRPFRRRRPGGASSLAYALVWGCGLPLAIAVELATRDAAWTALVAFGFWAVASAALRSRRAGLAPVLVYLLVVVLLYGAVRLRPEGPTYTSPQPAAYPTLSPESPFVPSPQPPPPPLPDGRSPRGHR